LKCGSSLFSGVNLTTTFILQNTPQRTENFQFETGGQGGLGTANSPGDEIFFAQLTSPSTLDESTLYEVLAWLDLPSNYVELPFYSFDSTGNTYLNDVEGYAGAVAGWNNVVWNYLGLSDARRPTLKRNDYVLFETDCDALLPTSLENLGLASGSLEPLTSPVEAGQGLQPFYTFNWGTSTGDWTTDIYSFGFFYPQIPGETVCALSYYYANGTELSNMPSAAGTYTYNISCAPVYVYGDAERCIQPASASLAFEITAATCGGTRYSCGLNNTCVVCGTQNLECEGGNTTVNEWCNSGVCIATSCSPGSYVYDIDFDGVTEDVACSNRDNVVLNVKLTKSGSPYLWTALESSACTLRYRVYPSGNWGEIYGLTLNPALNAYTYSFSGLACGSSYLLYSECTSPVFSRAKEQQMVFNVLTTGECLFNGISVEKGLCVSDVTKKNADKPLYCNNARAIVNNSAVCGCPVGGTANVTTNGCDGSGYMGGWLDGLGWFLTIGGILALIIFAPLYLKFLDVTGKRR
jgi:hypothetical protein